MKTIIQEKRIITRVICMLLILSVLCATACTTVQTQTETADGPETGETAGTVTEALTEPGTETEKAPGSHGGVKIKPVDPVVYPYIKNVRAYLEAGPDADIVDFMKKNNDQHEDITIEWEYDGEDEISSYIFEYSLNEDFSDSTSVTLSAATEKRKLTNLYKSAKYYVRVTAKGENTETSNTVSFETTSTGPRIMNVGGHYGNVRDLGGYVTEEGLIVLQDKVFRGSALDDCVNADKSTLTSVGKKYFNDEVGIKTELDLRGTSENCGRMTPALQSAENYIQVPIVNFQAAFYKEQAGLYKKVFLVFADEKNYPVYFHCAAGADRTGTVAAILLALLGVKKEEIIQDFEITSFSKAGERSKVRLMPVLNGLERYNGDTLSQKTENYLYSIGLSKKEIFSIKAIMLGLDENSFEEKPVYELQKRDFRYSTAKGGGLTLTMLEEAEASSVEINGVPIPFEQTGKKITLPEQALGTVGKGEFDGTVKFTDGGSLGFGVIIDEADITDDLNVTHRISGGTGSNYTYVFLSYTKDIFEGIEYHFHSRPADFPSVEANILINGVSLEELNKQSMSKYTFSEFPGSSVDRHKVPVTLLCQGDTVSLLIHTGWLSQYLGGKKLNVTVTKDFEFTNNGIRYYITRDKSYDNKNSGFTEIK